jgi:hypothetical protein
MGWNFDVREGMGESLYMVMGDCRVFQGIIEWGISGGRARLGLDKSRFRW